MLSKNQLITIWDYCKYFRLQSEKLARDAKNAPNFSPDLRGAIVNEQTRRARELKRLEKALGDEIEAHTERSIQGWPERAESPSCNDTRTKTTIQKDTTQERSKGRVNGRSSNANANDMKKKRGRPRKGAQIKGEGV